MGNVCDVFYDHTGKGMSNYFKMEYTKGLLQRLWGKNCLFIGKYHLFNPINVIFTHKLSDSPKN